MPSLRHSIKLVGPAASLRWPDVCVACGAPSSGTLPVTRVFDRDWNYRQGTLSSDDFRIIAVQTIAVPVCDACTRTHVQEARPVGPLRAVLSVVLTAWIIPVGVALVPVLLYLLPHLLGESFPLVAPPRRAWQAGVFALAAVVAAAAAWYQTRRRRVTPPTTVTAAFDFSDNLGGLFAAHHRVYGMDNDTFAQAFADANRDRVWTRPAR